MLLLMRRSVRMDIAFMMAALATVVAAARPSTGLFMAFPLVTMAGVFTAQRATPFEAAMPIPARHILAVRIATGLALVALPLLAWLLATPVYASLPTLDASSATPIRVLELFALGALGVVLPHAIRPGIIGSGRGMQMVPALGVMLLTQRALFATPSMAVAATSLAAAVTIFAFTWWAMPPSYQVASRSVARSFRWHRRQQDVPHRVGLAVPGDGPWWWAIARSVASAWLAALVVIVGVGGVTGNWIFTLVMLSVSSLAPARLRLRWLHTLPLSGHLLLLARMMPLLLPLLGVLLFSRLSQHVLRLDRSYLTAQAPHKYSDDHHFERQTNVSLQLWRRAPGRVPPALRAPWGESSVADTIRFAGMTFYNPYSAQTGVSPRFVAWQFTRAATTVYGRPISLAEYEADGFVPPPWATSATRVLLVGGTLALVFVLFLGWLVELAHWHVLLRQRWVGKLAPHLPSAAIFAIMGLHIYYYLKHGVNILESLGAMAALHIAGALPSTGALAALAIVLVAAMYGLVYWQAKRAEWTSTDGRVAAKQ